MIQWDDLRFFIAAARSGSFTDAARLAGADVATVSRRVARLETALKATLFVRSSSGLKLTAIGRTILEDSEGIEALVARVRTPAAQTQIAGTVRISVSEGFGGEILAPALPLLLKDAPGLNIELAANAGFLSPSTREVDIAVTLSAPNDSRLIVEPLTEYRLGLFAAPSYLERCGRPRRIADLLSHQIVGYIEDLVYSQELRYLDEIHPDLKTTVSSTSIHAQRAILKNGGGVGVLPFFLSAGLEQLFPQRISLTRKFWISTHRDVAETARIKFIHAALRKIVTEKASMLTQP